VHMRLKNWALLLVIVRENSAISVKSKEITPREVPKLRDPVETTR